MVGVNITKRKENRIDDYIKRTDIINDQNKYLEVKDFNFKRVHKFKYLSSLFTEKMKYYIKLRQDLQAGNRCSFGLTKLLRSK